MSGQLLLSVPFRIATSSQGATRLQQKYCRLKCVELTSVPVALHEHVTFVRSAYHFSLRWPRTRRRLTYEGACFDEFHVVGHMERSTSRVVDKVVFVPLSVACKDALHWCEGRAWRCEWVQGCGHMQHSRRLWGWRHTVSCWSRILQGSCLEWKMWESGFWGR